MLEWIKGNFPAVFAAAVITVLIVLAMIKLIKDRKTGTSPYGRRCGGNLPAKFMLKKN